MSSMTFISCLWEAIQDHASYLAVMSLVSFTWEHFSASLCLSWIHILEHRQVVCGMSRSWVSCIIFPGYFSGFPRALPHVWSGAGPSGSSVQQVDFTALHTAATAVPARQEKAWLSPAEATTQILSDLREHMPKAQGLSLQTLGGAPSPLMAHLRPGSGFLTKLPSMLKGDTSIMQRKISNFYWKFTTLWAHRLKHHLRVIK